MLQFAASKQHVQQNLVFVLEELSRLIDFCLDVVIARFRTHANFLEFLLVNLLGLVAFTGLLVAKLAIVQKFADGGPLVRSHFYKVETGFPSQVLRLCRRHDAELFPLGANEANRTDPNLVVAPQASILLRRIALRDTETSSNKKFRSLSATSFHRQIAQETLVGHAALAQVRRLPRETA
jgi:hypothetical protein